MTICFYFMLQFFLIKFSLYNKPTLNRDNAEISDGNFMVGKTIASSRIFDISLIKKFCSDLQGTFSSSTFGVTLKELKEKFIEVMFTFIQDYYRPKNGINGGKQDNLALIIEHNCNRVASGF